MGFNWRGVDWIHAMHFDAFAIIILLNCHIFFILELIIILCIFKNSVFSFLFHFGIVTYILLLLNFYSEDFLFTIGGYDMAPTCDSDTKKYYMLETSTSELKISNIWPTLRHVWDMSKTFPTKPCYSSHKTHQQIQNQAMLPWQHHLSHLEDNGLAIFFHHIFT